MSGGTLRTTWGSSHRCPNLRILLTFAPALCVSPKVVVPGDVLSEVWPSEKLKSCKNSDVEGRIVNRLGRLACVVANERLTLVQAKVVRV